MNHSPAVPDPSRVDVFFDGLASAMETYRAAKQILDVQIASEFSLFRYLSADELTISKILADLLDPRGPHGQGDLFLREFLALPPIAGALSADGGVGQPVPQLVRVRREVRTDMHPTRDRRLDLLVTFGRGDFALGIENKLDGPDQPDQVDDYVKHLSKKYSGRFILIYLSPFGGPPDQMSIPEATYADLEAQGRVRSLSYAADISSWLQKCRNGCEAERVRIFLSDMSVWIGDRYAHLPLEEEQ